MKKWKLISALGVLALLLSCVQEKDAAQPASLQPAEGQKMTINFSVAGPELQASTKVLNNGGDIQALYLAVFGSSGYLKEYVKADLTGESTKTYEVEKQVETATGETTVIKVEHTVPVYSFTARVTITDSPRRIHFLGNGPGSLPFGYDTAIMPLQMSQLSDSGVGEKAYWQVLDLPNGLPAKRNSNDNYVDANGIEYGQAGFSGFIPDPSLTEQFSEIPLIRNWAKIVLYAADPDESHFIPHSLAVVNFPSRGSIAPYGAQTGFVRNYQTLGFEDLEDMGYPANLPAGTQFNTSMPSADEFKATSFTDGGRVAGATTKEQIDSDTEDSGSAVYLYERPVPSESIPPTYVIIYGEYNNPDDPANSGKSYFYKVDLMESFLNELDEREYRYYPIFRNFKYQIKVTKILSRGHDTPEAAAISAGSADVSADITTGHLADISDGVGRLHLTWMNQTYIAEHDADHPVEDLHVFFSKSADGSADLDMESVEVKLLPPSDGGPNLISSIVKGAPVATPGDNYGWRQIRFCTAAPGKTIRSQTMRITGKYASGRLYRDVVVTVQPIQPMWVKCGKDRVNALRGVEQSVEIGIPDGLPKNMFPVSFHIEAQDLTLTPDNTKPNNNLPVVSGTSISSDDGYAGKASFQFVRTLTWDEYKSADIYESDDDKTWRTLTCYFKTNCPQNATKIWVKSQFFDTVSTQFYNYAYGFIHDGEITVPVPREADISIPFNFQVEPLDENNTYPELTLHVRGLINDADQNTGVSRGSYLDEYVFTPTSSVNTLYFITTSGDGDISLSISAPGYNALTIKPYKFNKGITQPWMYGLLEAQKSGNYWSNVAFGRVQIKKWNESSPSNRGVIFAYFDDPEKPLAQVTLKDPSGKIITTSKNANNSGLIANNPNSYPYRPTGPYSATGSTTYHELYLTAYSAQETISFTLSAPGYVTEEYSYGRLTGRVGLHTITIDASSMKKWYNSSNQTMMPPDNKTDNTYVKVQVEPLDGAPAPVVNANGMLLGQDGGTSTLPGGRYKITFTSGNIEGISGMNEQLKNQRFYFCQFELNPTYNLPSSVTPEKGTYFPYPGSNKLYNWVAFDNTSEYSVTYDPAVFSRYIIFEVEENQPVLITSLFIKTISNVPGT